ncbi:MAG: VCBS repeat-containing protein, partial [Flavobacteriaceae bacterium]|nr:VCBS repeat-containing protein [Flavobacteriaceae bacterium]
GSQNFASGVDPLVVEFSVGSIYDLYTGDLDNDGDIDIAGMDSDNGLFWLENEGSQNVRFLTKHTIDAATSFTTNTTKSVFIADINADGFLDILTGTSDDKTVAWYQNDGTAIPSFSKQTISSTYAIPYHVVAGDIDGDGDMDVIAAYRDNPADGGASWEDAVILYDNNGTQSFTPYTIIQEDFSNGYDKIQEVTSVNASDIDDDGDLDILVTSSGDTTLSWFENVDELKVVSIAPAHFENFVAVDANIVLNFNFNVKGAATNANHISVVGSKTGEISGSLLGDNSKTLTFDPTTNFKPGEVITLTLLPALEPTANTITFRTPVQFQFTVGGDANPSLTVVTPERVVLDNTTSGLKDIFTIDINGDGLLDIISASETDNSINWYKNNGDDTFTINNIASNVSGTVTVSAADMDNDGDIDILTVAATGGQITWYENNGSESFAANAITELVVGGNNIIPADVNNDGFLDIVVSSSSSSVGLVWYQNDGVADPTFSKQTIDSSTNFKTIFAVDLDEDNDLDIVYTSLTDANVGWYKYNSATGSFETKNILISGNQTATVLPIDIDGDGDPDLVHATVGATGSVSWYENNGNQSFTLRSIVAHSLDNLIAITAGDVDGDGDIDLLSASEGDDTIALFVNDGSQNFTKVDITTLADGVQSIEIADVDSNGDLDILSASLSDNSIAWYESKILLNYVSSTPTNGATHIAVDSNISATFDVAIHTDSETDDSVLVTGNLTGKIGGVYSVSGSTITFDPTVNFKPGELITLTLSSKMRSFDDGGLLNPRTIQFYATQSANDFYVAQTPFQRPIDATANSLKDIVVIDLNKDGFLDVISASDTDNTIAWYDGNTSFSRSTISTLANGVTAVYAVDIDGDDDNDILAASVMDQTIHWYENIAGVFTKKTISGDAGASDVFAFDIDNDGYIDVLSADPSNNAITWFKNNGSQGFTKIDIATGVTGASSVYATDVDGDGDIDILSASSGNNTIAWYINDGSQGFTKTDIATDAMGASSVFAIDVDGDG